MTPLDQASRDRIIKHLTFDIQDHLDRNEPLTAKDLAETVLRSMEALPPMLELLRYLAQLTVRANRMITLAQNFYPKDWPH